MAEARRAGNAPPSARLAFFLFVWHGQAMPLARWFYGSSSRISGDRASSEIASILAVSVPRNASLSVTGALLFTGARFAQYLEGCPRGVAELQSRILADPRHHEITTIAGGAVDDRMFPDWSLAYAGRSLFVQEEVERAIDAAQHLGHAKAERLVQLMRAFAATN